MMNISFDLLQPAAPRGCVIWDRESWWALGERKRKNKKPRREPPSASVPVCVSEEISSSHASHASGAAPPLFATDGDVTGAGVPRLKSTRGKRLKWRRRLVGRGARSPSARLSKAAQAEIPPPSPPIFVLFHPWICPPFISVFSLPHHLPATYSPPVKQLPSQAEEDL